jgi:DNA-binding NarL/FixJ family response regulator
MDIAVVGRHPAVRVGLRLLVEAQPGWRVVGEAARAGDRLRPSATAPDVVLVDVDGPGPSPARLLTRVAGRFPDARIVALGTADGATHERRAHTAGADAYVAKEGVDTLLIPAIERVAATQPSP